MALVLHLALLLIAQAGAQPNFLFRFCSDNRGNFTSNSTYKTNLDRVLSSISTNKEIDYGFYNFSYGHSSDTANAIGFCRGDVKVDACRSCLNHSIHILPKRCPNRKEAIGWYQNCTLRYSDRLIFGEMEANPSYTMLAIKNVSNTDQFSQVLSSLLGSLKIKASSGSSVHKYAAGNLSVVGFETIFALVQCTPDLSQQECDGCVSSLSEEIQMCCLESAAVLSPSCSIAYRLSRFFDATSEPPPPPPTPPLIHAASAERDKNKTVQIVIVILLSVVASWLLAICIYIFMRSRKRAGVDTTDEICTVESLQFDFNMIRAATDGFSDANKLGQGGFGVVYKGRLINGQEIAVKRLSQGSEQGDSEFKNELLLVAKLQHRNLVRLLGFCLERNERLLIFELVPNSSLDRFIFDPVKRRYLDWLRRYRIIMGITRGLLYLHEDSRLKIIHCDLKASNILLDAELIPKISDFGTARLFTIDQSQANTNKIAGTYGYMAPEYVMHGQFSNKSDVFSFGVLLLEIVSGRKNSSLQDGENIEHLLSYAWKSWREGTITNVIDPTLHRAHVDKIIRCIHIGLLCVQENVANRPTMPLVDVMLHSNSLNLPTPSQPAFLLHSNSSAMPLQSSNSEATLPLTTQSNSRHVEESVNGASLSDLEPR